MKRTAIGNVIKCCKRLAVFALFFFACTAAGADPDTPISKVYFEYAEKVIKEGRIELALEFLRKSIQFSDSYSDPYLVMAQLQSKNQAATQSALDNFYAALRINRWHTYSRQYCIERMVPVLHRTGRYRDVIALIDANTVSLSKNPDYYYWKAYGLLSLNQRNEAAEMIEEALTRFPEDLRFKKLQFKLHLLPPIRMKEWVDSYMSGDREFLNILFFYIEDLIGTEATLSYGKKYYELGGEDPLAAVYMAAQGSAVENALDLFESHDGMKDSYALKKMREELPQEYVGDFTDRFDDFTGTMGSDQNRDGFAEETFSFKNGKIIQWSIDHDQNGIPEFVFSFETPNSLVVNNSAHAAVQYGPYPYADWIEIKGETARRRFYLFPDSYELPFIIPSSLQHTDANDIFVDFQRVPYDIIIDTAGLPAKSYMYEDFTDDSAAPVQRVFLYESKPIRIVKDSNLDGKIDHIQLLREGQKVSGIRDVNFDGFFEVSEQYEDNRLVLAAFDEDGDNRPEYYEHYRHPASYAWDFDEDGTVDAAEINLGRERILRLFSSRLDGYLDIYLDDVYSSVPDRSSKD